MRLEGWSALADFVAEVFCPSECVRLIQDQARMRNVDSRNHSLRFDCCVFLFYSFSAVTFATQSAHRVTSLRSANSIAIGGRADMLAWPIGSAHARRRIAVQRASLLFD